MPASKRTPGRRVGWRNLTKAYRARLERGGIDRAAWESGADLRATRGHAPTPPPGAFGDRGALRRAIEGEGTEADWRRLGEFARMSRPSWLPPGLTPDVVAALSLLRSSPEQWSRVDFQPYPNGEPWTMTVTYARGYPQTIEIPGGGGQGTGAREILDLVHHPDWFERNGWQRHWRDWNPDDSDVHAS